MRIEFTKSRAGSPANLVAEAEIYFDATGPDGAESALTGMKLVGISVWKSNDPERGDFFVTFPSRPSGTGSERKYFDYLRSADPSGTPEGKAAIAKLKNRIVAAFKRKGAQ